MHATRKRRWGIPWLAGGLLVLSLAGCREGSSPPPVSRETSPPTRAAARDPHVLIRRAGEHALPRGWIAAGRPDSLRLREVARAGMTVLSLLPQREETYDEAGVVAAAGGTFLRHPLRDPDLTDPVYRHRLYALLDSLVTAGRPVYLHCRSSNRVGAAWTLYLAEHRGMSADDALARGREAGLKKSAPLVERILKGLPAAPADHHQAVDENADFGC